LPISLVAMIKNSFRAHLKIRLYFLSVVTA
jgi:hypothetical protein